MKDCVWQIRTHPERGQVDIAVLLHIPLQRFQQTKQIRNPRTRQDQRRRRGRPYLGEVDVEEEGLLGVGHLDEVAVTAAAAPLVPLRAAGCGR
jgi:hypothetical protein